MNIGRFVYKKVAFLGEWLELEVVNLNLELVKIEDLGFSLIQIVQVCWVRNCNLHRRSLVCFVGFLVF